MRKAQGDKFKTNGQPSLFDPDPVWDPDPENDTLDSEALVFELALEILGPPTSSRQEEGVVPDFIARARERRREKAVEEGLTARWSKEFGFIKIHDPESGKRYDVPMKDAPEWAKWEARKRKELYKAGDNYAYDLTSTQMHEIWEKDRPIPEEGIVEDHSLENDTQ